MAREEGDHYGIAQQADGMDMQTQQFPKGTQAFAHPRVVSAVNDICQEVKEAYEQLICWVHEVRERMKHLCSIVEGPYGSIYRNMRDHALVSQLTRWLKSVKCAFVTFDKLTAMVVDADLTREWGDKVEAQWREPAGTPPLPRDFALATTFPRKKLTELEQTLAGQGGLLGTILAAPGPGRLLSGFWAISEKY